VLVEVAIYGLDRARTNGVSRSNKLVPQVIRECRGRYEDGRIRPRVKTLGD
jgi:hypothetical protein